MIQMTRARNSRSRTGSFCIALAAMTMAILPSSAAAAHGEGELSPRLAKLAAPSLRGASDGEQARKLGLVSGGPGSLLRRGNRVLVYVRFDHGALAGAEDLRSAGGNTVDVSRRYQVDTVAAQPSQLRSLAMVPGVASIVPVLTPIVSAVAAGPVVATTPYVPCFGAETSEGDVQLGAAKARAEFEVAGTGTKVGILSDSFDRDPFAPTGAAEDILSGDLPGSANPCGEAISPEILDDTESAGEDEGRAMAQIVHDLAPGAAISFATAFNGEPDFAENIRALGSKGAGTIVDDVSYLEEPFFQEGQVGVAIGDVTENDDVAYFSSAGNNNLLEGEGSEASEIGSWEAPKFRDSGSCPAAVAALSPSLNPSHCMNFDPNSGDPSDNMFGITVEPGEPLTIDLQWAEPWEGVTTDLDAYLLSASGKLIAASTEKNISSSKQPLEVIGWENGSASPVEVQLAINRRIGSGARLKFVLVENGGGVSGIEYDESSEGDVVGPTIFGHNGGEHTMSIGAIRYNAKSKPEFFSSRGPVTHYFSPITGTGPAPSIPTQVLAKPDLVATDGGADTFFGSCFEGAWRFFGTSAAAPHAAAVAALEREAEPAADAAEVKEAQGKGALAVGEFPPTAVGAGLLDAPGTLEKLGAIASNPGAAAAEPPVPGPCAPPRTLGGPPQESPAPQTPSAEGATPTRPPNTFFLRRPSRVTRTSHRQAKVAFQFGSNQTGVSFVCRIDAGLFRPCPKRLVRRFPLGWHTVRVAARDGTGTGDKTPAVYRFEVKHVG